MFKIALSVSSSSYVYTNTPIDRNEYEIINLIDKAKPEREYFGTESDGLVKLKFKKNKTKKTLNSPVPAVIEVFLRSRRL